MSTVSGKLTFSFPEMKGDERLRELIIYISKQCMDDPGFGATKLNKILYFSDFISFAESGKPITGVEYMKLDNGPVPKHLKPLRDEMQAEREILLAKRQLSERYEQHRVIPLRDANLDMFHPKDIALIDEIIRVFWGKKAREVSDLSHGMAWEITRDRGIIPYEAALLSDEEITEDDIVRTRELSIEYGWNSTPAQSGKKVRLRESKKQETGGKNVVHA